MLDKIGEDGAKKEEINKLKELSNSSKNMVYITDILKTINKMMKKEQKI